MSEATDGQSSPIPRPLRGALNWIGSIRHWELIVLMLIAAAVLLGYFVGSLLVIYRLFNFISIELFVGLTVTFVIIGTYGLTKWDLRRRRNELTPLPTSDAPQLHSRVDKMSAELGISRPDLYIIEDESPNAYALGTRWDGIIVIHSGLFRLLENEEEMAAIVGHELAHLYYCDSLLMGAGSQIEQFLRKLGRVIAYVLLTICTLGLFLAARGTKEGVRTLRAVEVFLAIPILLSQNALSRYREFVADSTAATLLGDAGPMISALSKLEGIEAEDTDRLSPVNPVDRSRRLLRTHPSFDRRTALLRDDFERDRAGFVPFYAGPTLGTFTKFGLTVAPLFLLGLFVVAVISLNFPVNQYFANPGPGVALIILVGFLIWFVGLFAFPWAMLFAPGGRPFYGLTFLTCITLWLFTSAVGRFVPLVPDIGLVSVVGYTGMTLVVALYGVDATRTLIQQTEGSLSRSAIRVGQSGLKTTGRGLLTIHLSIASSRLIQACLLVTSLILYVSESVFSWVLGVYLLLAVFTDWY